MQSFNHAELRKLGVMMENFKAGFRGGGVYFLCRKIR